MSSPVRLTLLLVVVMVGGTYCQPPRDVPPPPRHHGYNKIVNMVMDKYMDGVQDEGDDSADRRETSSSQEDPETAWDQKILRQWVKRWKQIVREIDEWGPGDKRNIWELSGLLEGDIMEDSRESRAPSGVSRNAVRDLSSRWPSGVVPYHISDEFDEDEMETILGAMDDFHENSCIRFRPYRRGDKDWITIRGDSPGCWSYVGRRRGGQVVNLGRRCVQHGVASHELLHALGFHHQQSSHNRDKFVKIHWPNIRRGTEGNFRKYTSGRITDFDVPYDYESVMHYSTHAFSKNGNPTITPKRVGARIGQRSRMSERDIMKLNIMYDCRSRNNFFHQRPQFHFKHWNYGFR